MSQKPTRVWRTEPRDNTQSGRCSDQNHLWRRSTLTGIEHMRCRCGAVHPNDLEAFLSHRTGAV